MGRPHPDRNFGYPRKDHPPAPGPSLRCCIYKERAIINSRVKLAMGGDKSNPCLVEVLPIACDECPVTEITVGPSCRGCLATRCVHACPKDAITIVNHRACIDHEKLHLLRPMCNRLSVQRHSQDPEAL